MQAETFFQAARSSVLMRKLPAEAHGYLLRAAKLRNVKAGEKIYEEGAEVDAFYVINLGQFRATVMTLQGSFAQLVRELGPGDTFGSHELILNEKKRSVTVTALDSGSVWTLPVKVFDSKIKVAPAPAPSLVSRVSAVPLFAGLSKDKIKQLCRAAIDGQTVAKGDKLGVQGAA